MSQDPDSLPIDSRTRAIIDGMPPEDKQQIEQLMTRAARGQRQMLENALEDAVRMVPAPFRKRVQKMFLG